MIDLSHLKSGLRRVWRHDEGAAAVEFALVMPILIMLLFGIVEFARAWNARQVLTDAAREGTRIAVVAERNDLTPAELVAKVRSTVWSAAANAALDTTQLTMTPTVGGAAGTEASVALTYQYQPLFGRWVLPAGALQMSTTTVMRNE